MLVRTRISCFSLKEDLAGGSKVLAILGAFWSFEKKKRIEHGFLNGVYCITVTKGQIGE